MMVALPYILLALGAASLAVAIFNVAPVSSDNNLALALLGRGTRVTLGVILVFVGGMLLLDLSWMQWTSSTAAFFVGLFSLLVGMTIWDIVDPTDKHPQGFLPVAFSRGERLFLSFMIFFGVLGLWLAFIPDVTLWGALGLAAVLIVVTARWG